MKPLPPTFTVREPSGALFLAGLPESQARRIAVAREGRRIEPDGDNVPGTVTRGPQGQPPTKESE